jgi:hypothetical protein
VDAIDPGDECSEGASGDMERDMHGERGDDWSDEDADTDDGDSDD